MSCKRSGGGTRGGNERTMLRSPKMDSTLSTPARERGSCPRLPTNIGKKSRSNVRELNFENIMDMSLNDFTPQSFLTISAPDSFQSQSGDGSPSSGAARSTEPNSVMDTPPYPIANHKNSLLLSSPGEPERTPLKSKIPLPEVPNVSPFDTVANSRALNENIPPDKVLSPILCDIAPKQSGRHHSTIVLGTKNATIIVDGRTEVGTSTKVVELNNTNPQRSMCFSQGNKSVTLDEGDNQLKIDREADLRIQ